MNNKDARPVRVQFDFARLETDPFAQHLPQIRYRDDGLLWIVARWKDHPMSESDPSRIEPMATPLAKADSSGGVIQTRVEANILFIQLLNGKIVEKADIMKLDKETKDAITAEPDRHVVLDLSCINALTSVALGVFIGLLNALRVDGRRLHLAALTPPTSKVLAITKTTQLFHIFQTVEDAKRELSECPVRRS